MPSSCSALRSALATCLQNSDCILISRHTPLECLSSPHLETLPVQCQQLKRGFKECKRGMLDMRKRFRGNAPLGVGGGAENAEGGMEGQGWGGQMYGGKPAFEAVPEGAKGRGEEKGLGFDAESRGL